MPPNQDRKHADQYAGTDAVDRGRGNDRPARLIWNNRKFDFAERVLLKGAAYAEILPGDAHRVAARRKRSHWNIRHHSTVDTELRIALMIAGDEDIYRPARLRDLRRNETRIEEIASVLKRMQYDCVAPRRMRWRDVWRTEISVSRTRHQQRN